MEFVMLGLIALLIFFMFRNGKKRQKAMQELRAGLVPGADIILQPGIFATVEEIDEEHDRLTVRSGSSTLIVHRNMVAQIVSPVVVDEEETSAVAPDDDPAFGEHYSDRAAEVAESNPSLADAPDADGPKLDDSASTDSNGQTDTDQGDAPRDDRSA